MPSSLGIGEQSVFLIGVPGEQEFIDAALWLKSLWDNPKIIAIYSDAKAAEGAIHVLIAGASGIIELENADTDIPDMIRCVARGGAVIPPWVARQLLDLLARLPHRHLTAEQSLSMLSLRERQVLKHMIAGQTNAEIAQTLSISEATVRSHISHLLCKLNLRNRVDAIVYAYSFGFTSETS